MKDTQKLLSEMNKPEYVNTNHQQKLRRALMNSDYFEKKQSVKPKMWVPVYLGTMLGALILAVVFFGPDLNYTKDGQDNPVQNIVSHISERINNDNNSDNPQDTDEDVKEFALGSLRRFGSEEELRHYLVENYDGYSDTNELQESVLSGRDGVGGGYGEVFSVTNNQVKNIQEPDSIKNDDKYTYIAEGSYNIGIYDVYPADQMKKVSTINVLDTSDDDWSNVSLLQSGDTLVAVVNDWAQPLEGKPYSPRCGFLRVCPKDFQEERTLVKVYDISDRFNPVLKDETSISGYFVDARMIDDHIYIISEQFISQKQVIFPSIIHNGEESFIGADDIYYDSDFMEPSPYLRFSNISSVDTKDGSVFTQATLSDYVNNVYVSGSNVYTVTQNWSEEGAEESTTINRIAIDGDSVEYKATGEVKGFTESQFSFDEFEGNLRVATTTGAWWDESSVSHNHIFVLNEDLEEIGALENLAPEERIYAVRFAGEKAYLVTFKDVDPFFVIDLSDPKNPSVLGELKIPGYSDYLHMYDENTVIGIGMDTENERTSGEDGDVQEVTVATGLRFGLFDVSDVNNPREIDSKTVGGFGSYSNVLYDHKGFLFDPDRNFFAIPATLADRDQETGDFKTTFNGALVYKVDKQNGFRELWRINNQVDDNGDVYESDLMTFYFQGDTVERLFYIDNYLYSMSSNKLKAHKLWTFEELGSIDL